MLWTSCGEWLGAAGDNEQAVVETQQCSAKASRGASQFGTVTCSASVLHTVDDFP